MRLSSISQTTFSSPSCCADVLLSETNLSKQNVSRRQEQTKQISSGSLSSVLSEIQEIMTDMGHGNS